MAEQLLLTKLYEGMTFGKVTRWFKTLGDSVNIGDQLAEIETDKVTVEMTAEIAGVILYQHEAPSIEVDRLVCVIGEPGEDIQEILIADQQKGQFFYQQGKSIRTFIGAKDFDQSREFYWELGFTELILSDKMSYFSVGKLGFYLQQYYVRDWVDNSMVFLEVDDADATYEHLRLLDLPERYAEVRLIPVREEPWGKECFLHDPSGVLWHFGQFYQEEALS